MTREKSKREMMREKRRRDEQRSRLFLIGAVVVGVLLVAFAIIYPQLKPIDQPVAAAPHDRPDVNRNSMGKDNAPIQITEFSDYQCPYCKNFWEKTEQQIVDAYVKDGKVKFTYRSAGNWVSRNIGGSSTESEDAAMSTYCAADQGKFWEMHDALFTNVLGEDAGSFAPRRIKAIAELVGLDMTAFDSCFSSQKYKAQTDQDLADAMAAGIQGTPYFIINYTVNGEAKTRKIDGAQPFSAFQTEIDAALAEMGLK